MPPESNQVGPVEEPAPKKKWVFVDLVDGSDTMIILFGWAGCQQRYLAKYAQFYKEAGLVGFFLQLGSIFAHTHRSLMIFLQFQAVHNLLHGPDS